MSQNQAAAEDQGHDFFEDIVTAVSVDRSRELAARIDQVLIQLVHARLSQDQLASINALRNAAQDLRMTCGSFVGSPTQLAARAAERLGTRLLLGTRVALAEWMRVQEQLETLRRSL